MEFRVHAAGLQFPEGPVAMADGSVVLVEIQRQTLTRIRPDGRQEVIAHLGGGPNGAAIGPDGGCYVCNNGGFKWATRADGSLMTAGTPDDYRTGSIQRVDLRTGRFQTLYEQCDGSPLRGPNDLVFDRDGGFWFSDLGKTDDQGRDHGAVYYARADGSGIVRARDRMTMPNGVGLSPDGRRLYVAETLTGRLWDYEVLGPGRLRVPEGLVPGRVVTTLPDYQMFDSLALQADGRVCVATIVSGRICVVDPLRGTVEYVDVPHDCHVTNICFGGADMRDAWITCSGRGLLLHARWPVPGLRLAFNG